MFTIVPLAGPDFFTEKHGIKPLYSVEGIPLIKKALQSRPWNHAEYLNSSKIIFVLRQDSHLPEFKEFLKREFPNSASVELSTLTKGALCSALAGASLISDFKSPIAVDLVDILYEAKFSPTEIFNTQKVDGILPWFRSNDPDFSYLEISENRIIKAVEKQVISEFASAGTYFFRNLQIFSAAVASSISNAEKVAFRGNLFVCPAFSFLNGNVLGVEVSNVQVLSKHLK